MEYKKDDLVTLTIEDIGIEGEGIGKIDGFAFFVKDAVVGDVIRAKVMKAKKNYAYARLMEIITPSKYRLDPKCPIARQCGGCQIQQYNYEQQLAFKQRKVFSNLQRIGGFSKDFLDQIFETIVGMEEPYRYRNKAQYPIGMDREGNPIAGFYAGRTHSIIPNTDCLLGCVENKDILEMILAHMKANHIPAYQEETGKGLVRHVLIRKGFTSGEIMVCLVLNGKVEQLTHLDELVEKLCTIDGMTSISASINTENTNVIMGKKIVPIWGKDTITDSIHVRNMQEEGFPFTGRELSFSISPLSFYQVNPVQTEKLYSLALEYAGLTGKESVWDLYCGIGTISLFLAGQAGKVYGVEIIPQAIDDAKQNAINNSISNAEFFVGKAEEVLPKFYAGQLNTVMFDTNNLEENNDAKSNDMLHPDVIVVDPPRKGCDKDCLDTMLKMQPDRIVYVSCDSATLARDLKILCEGGYELQKVRPVDMFAHTVHVETCCLLQKQV